MAFFDLPKDEDIPAAARHWLDELKRLRGIETLPQSRLAYVSTPWILEAQVTAETNLSNQRSGRSVLLGSSDVRVHAGGPRPAVQRVLWLVAPRPDRPRLRRAGPRRHLCQPGRAAATRARPGLRALRAPLRAQRDGRRAQGVP